MAAMRACCMPRQRHVKSGNNRRLNTKSSHNHNHNHHIHLHQHNQHSHQNHQNHQNNHHHHNQLQNHHHKHHHQHQHHHHHHPHHSTISSNNNNNNNQIRVIPASEYKNLRQVVPSLKRQRDVGKIEVVTEAARYIDHLHKTLIERFIIGGIPDSLKDLLGTDNAKELNSNHIMRLVSRMAQQQQQQQTTAANSTRLD